MLKGLSRILACFLMKQAKSCLVFFTNDQDQVRTMKAMFRVLCVCASVRKTFLWIHLKNPARSKELKQWQDPEQALYLMPHFSFCKTYSPSRFREINISTVNHFCHECLRRLGRTDPVELWVIRRLANSPSVRCISKTLVSQRALSTGQTSV